MNYSPLQKARYEYKPKLPGMLRHGIAEISVKEGEATKSVADQEKIAALFPNTYGKKEITFVKGENTSAAKKQVVGVILSGGQAPGGHNVVCGLYDALKATDKENVLYGFKNGPSGLLEDDYLIFDDEYIDQFRNTGGFDIIGSGRTKLETEAQFAVAAEVCKKHGITAIVIIGGDGIGILCLHVFQRVLVRELGVVNLYLGFAYLGTLLKTVEDRNAERQAYAV